MPRFLAAARIPPAMRRRRIGSRLFLCVEYGRKNMLARASCRPLLRALSRQRDVPVDKPGSTHRQRFFAACPRTIHPVRLIAPVTGDASLFQNRFVAGPKLIPREDDGTNVEAAPAANRHRAGDVGGERLARLARLLAVVVRKGMGRNFLSWGLRDALDQA